MALRLLFLSGHHRSQLNFTWKSLDQAKTNFQRISDWISNLDKINDEKKSNLVDLKRYKKKFEEAMDDDLNTPLALSILFELITETNKLIAEKKLGKEESKNILSFWEKMNKVFGLIITKEEKIPEKISKIAEARKTARENKDFKASDELREKLEKLGYTIEDLKDNKYTIKRK